MNAKEGYPAAPETVDQTTKELAGKTEIEQVELLSLWRKQPSLADFCTHNLDQLYLRNKTLFENYARSTNGDFIVRASCLEVLRRHRNFSINLPADDKSLAAPITGYELVHNTGLVDFRREWTIYRIEGSENPQYMFDKLKTSEPQNKVIFDELEKVSFSGSKLQPAQLQKPVEVSGTPTSSTQLAIVAVLIAASGLLWLFLKNRSRSKTG